jgi:hypothetical protein
VLGTHEVGCSRGELEMIVVESIRIAMTRRQKGDSSDEIGV